ncbi:hypothetical protein [Streptomyces sp. NPDC048411]|uniref:hypothetical protein n=1 Tax=Streptomyces sp. NPDC048411 TaxID=3157206 RepID=UPI003454CC52
MPGATIGDAFCERRGRARAASDLGGADFAKGTGSVHVEATLTLNYVQVRCMVDIDLTSLSGSGHLVALVP